MKHFMLGVGFVHELCTYYPRWVYDFCSNIRRGRRFLCEISSTMFFLFVLSSNTPVSSFLVLLNMANSIVKAKIPPPLQIPPSRARRQFALRLAQRKAELGEKNSGEGDNNDSNEKTQEQEEREGHQRFARMFEDIESDSDDGSLGSIEDEIIGRLDVESRLSPGKERKPEAGPSTKKDDGDNVVVV